MGIFSKIRKVTTSTSVPGVSLPLRYCPYAVEGKDIGWSPCLEQSHGTCLRSNFVCQAQNVVGLNLMDKSHTPDLPMYPSMTRKQVAEGISILSFGGP